MKTPICDFVKNYISQNNIRLHMPGHKGCGLLGFEEFDITEITGADSLFEADGIIKESEQNASSLFGCDTFYSTEGSSHCIRAMLYLALTLSDKGKKIAAGRNAHKTFLSAAALLDLEVDWLYGKGKSYLSLDLSAEDIDEHFKNCGELPFALYLTSPDYLGNRLNLKKIAEVCHKYDVLLLVDNAHGAYLKFLNNSEHPIDSGADLCSDSAHKTLPALTGGADLNFSGELDCRFKQNAKSALSLFGSTSPSYLILQSLDAVNKYLSEYKPKLNEFVLKMQKLKENLKNSGYLLVGDEPLKITVFTKPYGYTGMEIAEILSQNNMVSEFFDSDFITLMLTPENGDDSLNKILSIFKEIPKKREIKADFPEITAPKQKLSIRNAAFAPSERVESSKALGRISALPTVGCPPAVPIVMCGEEIDRNIISRLEYYKIEKILVVK